MKLLSWIFIIKLIANSNIFSTELSLFKKVISPQSKNYPSLSSIFIDYFHQNKTYKVHHDICFFFWGFNSFQHNLKFQKQQHQHFQQQGQWKNQSTFLIMVLSIKRSYGFTVQQYHLCHFHLVFSTT